jgi:hypothetical protein
LLYLFLLGRGLIRAGQAGVFVAGTRMKVIYWVTLFEAIFMAGGPFERRD